MYTPKVYVSSFFPALEQAAKFQKNAPKSQYAILCVAELGKLKSQVRVKQMLCLTNSFDYSALPLPPDSTALKTQT